ncbi:DUF1203 domain-containing protein [Colwellia psychrerythraea]|uniref:DUF1203 domain-containing protein n=1 Tax=Colwellia psychrerythraea TaxID=28229 RepID=A0A099KXC7_COLPS|nr:DUF1203 domain-containing protein [Colwellia psychrerythraea]KGJ94840.1 protein of unknown function DUF1203 [Colwellia psychrerythraea]
MNYKITPIRRDFLIKVRQAGIDDQNQPVIRQVATGGEPCRDVLRRAAVGEELILASYCPFSIPGPYKEYGAVFVLAKQSSEWVNYDEFPIPNNATNDYFGEIFVLKAYDKYESIIAAQLVTPENVEQIITEYFQQTKASFLMARYAAYGCYSLRLDRKV